MDEIYKKLRDYRRARGISVDQLAKEMGEKSQKVGRIERGQRSLTVDYLLKVSKALATPIETILEHETPAAAPNSFDSNILNDVVVLVEEIAHKLPIDYTSQQKAKMISKIYENLLKLPQEQQPLFFGLLKECLTTLLTCT